MDRQSVDAGNKSKDQLRERSKAFALRVIRLVNKLPESRAADVIGKQLLRSGTSVGANYRSACRARSAAEFCAKMGIVEEEADESGYWMELLVESELVKPDLLKNLMQESNEIVAMTVASIKTTRFSWQTRLTHCRIPHSEFRTPHFNVSLYFSGLLARRFSRGRHRRLRRRGRLGDCRLMAHGSSKSIWQLIRRLKCGTAPPTVA